MQNRINKFHFRSHYLKIFILLKFYIDFLKRLRQLENSIGLDLNREYEEVVENDRVQSLDKGDATIYFNTDPISAIVTDGMGHQKYFSFDAEGHALTMREGNETISPTNFSYTVGDGLLDSITYPL